MTRKQKKLPCSFDVAFFKTVPQKNSLPYSSLSSEETLQPAQLALPKNIMPRNEAKIYQETYFLSTEGHLLTSGCFLTLTSSLDVVQVRFAFVASCL